ncbi:MAG: glycosyltransferase family 4 protein [Pseudolabrys sp.]
MQRLIFLNRFFFPDQSATSQILSDLAFHLAGCGWDVHIITSRQLYEDSKASLRSQESVRGVTVHRVLSTRFGRTSLARRAVDYLSYYLSATWKLFTLAKADDIVIAMTDPPLVSIFAMCAVRMRRAKLVNWLQDIYPEIAIEMGVLLGRSPAGRCLAYLRDVSLRVAVVNVTVGEQMALRLKSRLVSPDRVHVIANWCDDEDILPVSPADNPLRQSWGLQDKFVVGYSGNLGRGHEFDTILAASERFRTDPSVVFVMIGGGYRFEELRQQVKAKGIDGNYRFFPYQDRKLLKYSLSVPDLHWISLQPALSDLLFPSKFYGIAAAGRPMLALTGSDGEIARLVRDHDCGVAMEPGDIEGAANAIASLAQDRTRREKMGINARAMLDSKFTRRHAFEQWKNLFERLLAA